MKEALQALELAIASALPAPRAFWQKALSSLTPNEPWPHEIAREIVRAWKRKWLQELYVDSHLDEAMAMAHGKPWEVRFHMDRAALRDAVNEIVQDGPVRGVVTMTDFGLTTQGAYHTRFGLTLLRNREGT